VSVALSDDWHPIAEFTPGAVEYVASNPALLDLVRDAFSASDVPLADLEAALQSHDLSEISKQIWPECVALALLEKLPQEATHVLQDAPVARIEFDDGSSEVISRMDLLRSGLDWIEGLSVA